jgi:hypothetical protein
VPRACNILGPTKVWEKNKNNEIKKIKNPYKIKYFFIKTKIPYTPSCEVGSV